MIFSSKNEDGVPKWKQVLDGTATVTRRLKPVKVGRVYAVQPNRCKKAVCYIRIKSCVKHSEWFENICNTVGFSSIKKQFNVLQKESKLEGFGDWSFLLDFFENKKIEISDTYRIEFEVVK